ncbi:MAG: D-glucuronyl C5-epimerase family protein [Solirubrobacteraceae bacterium]
MFNPLVRAILAGLLALAVLAPAAGADAVHVLPPDPGYGPAAGAPAPCGAQAPPPARGHARSAANGPSVPAVLDRLEARGALSAADHDRLRGLYSAALATRARLAGTPKLELAAVIRTLDGFARGGVLTSSRVPVLFLQLQRNSEYWQKGRLPVAPQPPVKARPCAGKAGLGGARVMFGSDPTVFQWYPGQGLQIQELATFARANALAKACLPGADVSFPCKPDELRAAANCIAALAVDRGGFRAWEYYFAFGGGRPPWVSSIATGTAIQALTRAAQALGDPSYLEVARAGLGAFSAAAPRGVRAKGTVGPHYLLYSFAPGLRVFNAFLQSLVGLRDFATATQDPAAGALFSAGDREARAEIPRADTGAWSRYSLGGAESDLGYHRLLRDVLQNLCDRTAEGVYCATAKRFSGYLHQRTRVSLLSGGPQARVAVSKISCVTLTVTRGPRVVAQLVRVLPRGTWTLPWRAASRGHYVVHVDARDLVNHHTVVTRAVTVRH